MWHYYHFVAEVLMGGIAALSNSMVSRSGGGHRRELYEKPARAVMPFDEGYLDAPGLNPVIYKGIWGNDALERKDWDNLTENGAWVSLQRGALLLA